MKHDNTRLRNKKFLISLPNFKKMFVKYLIVSLSFVNFLGLLTNPVSAQQRRIVTVTADQPNIWTLEQAHYLLAQMHRRNLDLKAKGLNPLDAQNVPNATTPKKQRQMIY